MSNKTTTAAKKPETKSTTKAAPIESKPPVTETAESESTGAGWDMVSEAVKKAKEAGAFIKLEDDGDSFVGVMMGQPYVRRVTFENSEFNKNKAPKPTTRIAINVAVIDEKSKEITGVKVWEAGPMFYKGMLTVKDKFDLNKWALSVTRNGKAKSSRTTYVVLPDHELSAAERATVGELELHDLEALGNPDTSFDPEKLEEDAAE